MSNRFYDIPGDVSMQLSPWETAKRGLPDGAFFELQKDITFRSDLAGDIVVPAGFVSDLASIPRFAWAIFMAPDDPHIELGGWVHDRLYGLEGKVNEMVLTRAQCDHILAYECMADLGASDFKKFAVYKALRWFGDRWKDGQ